VPSCWSATPDNLGIAFGNRANGYLAKRDYRSAVTDYARTIQLKPTMQ
jgi:hypothetical protein